MNRLVRAAVHVAWRRWPAQLRDERRREWEAELAVLASEPDRSRLARTVGQLRYALSLAWSPPVEDEHGIPAAGPNCSAFSVARRVHRWRWRAPR
ncbi:hypothetical protein [Dactylosporangium darangshiense]|uniref:hypothetical protein n=1 Tax=Dactylosporangium darangshiense TaxID=579108 RepID=UPI00362655DA